MKRFGAVFLFGVALSAGAQIPGSHGGPTYNTQYVEPEAWKEQQDIQAPAFPRPESLVEFYVSPVATNHYFIDTSTLAVGGDDVIRYVLVVKTSGGATNVSFEGMNCKERSWKYYATGNYGKASWTMSRAARVDWRPIENKEINRHHAALSRDFFCPAGYGIRNADEGRDALRRGKHPRAEDQ